MRGEWRRLRASKAPRTKMPSYLEHLNARLADRLSVMPQDFRHRHASYLAAGQRPDGGFPGRDGGSDLYYTAFALRGLAILDALTPKISARAGQFLRSCLAGDISVVDFFSFLFGCLLVQSSGGPDVLADSPPSWSERVATILESFRSADGGYRKTGGAISGSTYHTFLVGLCYQLLGKEWPRSDDVVRFVHARQRDDGGFVEIPAMRRSGANPTAAAIGTLHLIQGLEASLPRREQILAFLHGLQSPEGGFRANDRIPLADLLSTFTITWTLEQIGGLQGFPLTELDRFVQSLQSAAGGFRAGLWDEQADVEYTFYGLGTIACIGSTSP
jgi:geranylgeranyl transferase type-2 subunit beta